MSQTSCERCGFPIPLRWLHAGGNLSQPNRICQSTDRASVRSECPPKGLSRSADLPYNQTRTSHPISIRLIIKLGARIKSP
jgi:hypothetical protein